MGAIQQMMKITTSMNNGNSRALQKARAAPPSADRRQQLTTPRPAKKQKRPEQAGESKILPQGLQAHDAFPWKTPSGNPASHSQSDVVCICRKEACGELIQCSCNTCSIRWFHRKCAHQQLENLKRIRQP